MPRLILAVVLLLASGQSPDLSRVEAELTRLERAGLERRSACMAAFGHAPFCQCIADHLPIAVDFTHYVEVVTTQPSDDRYKALTPDWKDVVDATRAARDVCVSTALAP